MESLSIKKEENIMPSIESLINEILDNIKKTIKDFDTIMTNESEHNTVH